MRVAASRAPVATTAVPFRLLTWLAACLAAAGCFIVLFGPGILFVAREWEQPEYSHGWLIPFITLTLLWYRRPAVLRAWGPGSWWGLALVAAALVVYLLAQMAFVQRAPFVLGVLVLGGLGLAAFGARAMRYVWPPLLFIYFAFPLPGSVAVPLSTTLQLISSNLGAGILRALDVSVFLDGNVIDLGGYMLQVAEACSGLRYLFPLACFGFLCAWLYKAPLWARAVVLLSIVPITIVTNSARIALTGIFIEYGYRELAEGFLHLFEGWVIFTVALAILFALMWLLRLAVAGPRAAGELLDFDRMAGGASVAALPPQGPPLGSLPLPLIGCLLVLLVVAVGKGPLVDRAQIIPARPGLVTYPLSLGDWRGQAIPIEDQSVLKFLGANDHLLAEFASPQEQAPVNLWVAYYDEQLNDAGIHSPKDCLPGGGWEYVSLTTAEVPAVAGMEPFKVNRGLIAKGTQEMVIYYWLDMRGRKITNDTMLKLYNLWDSFMLGRSDGALVRMMTPVLSGETPEAAYRRLDDFFLAAAPPLRPHIDR